MNNKICKCSSGKDFFDFNTLQLNDDAIKIKYTKIIAEILGCAINDYNHIMFVDDDDDDGEKFILCDEYRSESILREIELYNLHIRCAAIKKNEALSFILMDTTKFDYKQLDINSYKFRVDIQQLTAMLISMFDKIKSILFKAIGCNSKKHSMITYKKIQNKVYCHLDELSIDKIYWKKLFVKIVEFRDSMSFKLLNDIRNDEIHNISKIFNYRLEWKNTSGNVVGGFKFEIRERELCDIIKDYLNGIKEVVDVLQNALSNSDIVIKRLDDKMLK